MSARVPRVLPVIVDSDRLVKCSLCAREAFVMAEWGGKRPVPLCADCFARVEPEVMRAAHDRQPDEGPPVRLIRSADGG